MIYVCNIQYANAKLKNRLIPEKNDDLYSVRYTRDKKRKKEDVIIKK